MAALVLVFVVASAALLLAQLAPGDYGAQFGSNPAAIAAERHRLGLDRPFFDQYAGWLRRSLTLDLGESFQYHRPVIDAGPGTGRQHRGPCAGGTGLCDARRRLRREF